MGRGDREAQCAFKKGTKPALVHGVKKRAHGLFGGVADDPKIQLLMLDFPAALRLVLVALDNHARTQGGTGRQTVEQFGQGVLLEGWRGLAQRRCVAGSHIYPFCSGFLPLAILARSSSRCAVSPAPQLPPASPWSCDSSLREKADCAPFMAARGELMAAR